MKLIYSLILITLCAVVCVPVSVCAANAPTRVAIADLKPGALVGQDGWTMTGTQTPVVESSFTRIPGNNALEFDFPYANGSHPLPSFDTARIAEIYVGMGFAPVTDSKAGVAEFILVAISDANGKKIAQVARESNGAWNAQRATGYSEVASPDLGGAWTTVRITLNPTERTYSAALITHSGTKPLFSGQSYVDKNAVAPARISISRTGAGPKDPAFVDQISISYPKPESHDKLSMTEMDAPAYAVLAGGKSVHLMFNADRPDQHSADVMDWRIDDYLGRTVKSGKLTVPDAVNFQKSIWVDGLSAGYYKVDAHLVHSGLTFAEAGSRPAGMATFGILPEITPLPLARPDEARFGTQGTNFLSSGKWMVGDPFKIVYGLLNLHWVNDGVSWKQLAQKPIPAISSYEQYAVDDHLALLYCVNGFPQDSMAIPADVNPGTVYPEAYPPKDLAAYSDAMKTIAQHCAALRKKYAPNQRDNYYQVMWEPDWHWKGTDEQFIAMYGAAYRGLHAGDPNAVVLGPGTGVLSKTVLWLTRMLPLGLDKYIDGVATHGYYLNPPLKAGAPPLPPGTLISPEDANTPEDFGKVHDLTRKYLKPNAPIFQTEWGLDYHAAYSSVSDALLLTQAAYIVRGHLIALGEGCNVDYFFYTSDYDGEQGFGLSFNLTMPQPNFGAVKISPKPSFMALAAMTRLLDGTRTLGRVAGLPKNVYAYAFQRGDKTVIAAWRTGDAPTSVVLPAQTKTIDKYDFMGNRSTETVGKSIKIALSRYPQYILGIDTKQMSIKPMG